MLLYKPKSYNVFLYSIFRSIDLKVMMKKRTTDFFFPQFFFQTNTSALSNLIEPSIVDNETFVHEEECLAKAPQLDGKEVDINSLERDLGKCPSMWSYLVNQ